MDHQGSPPQSLLDPQSPLSVRAVSDPSHKSTVITVGYCAKNDLTQCEFGQGAASQGLSFPICRMEVWHNQSQIPPSPNLQFVKLFWASLMAQRLKCLPAMQETCVRSLGREDPLEKGMATHSSILAWRIPCTEEPGGLQSTGSQRVGHD